MAGPSYKTRAIVLRKVRLGEKDLIVVMLGQDGAQIRAVAKGARKPGGSLAGRLELFSLVDVMCAPGRNLHVVTEARSVRAGAAEAPGAASLEFTACASVAAELLEALSQEGLEHRRLFDMGAAYFSALAGAQAPAMTALTAAVALKSLASCGFGPILSSCASCGGAVGSDARGRVPVSVGEGGAVCQACPRPPDAVLMAASTVDWCSWLLGSRFAEIAGATVPGQCCAEALHFLRNWVRYHVGRDLKSLDFLFTCGMV